MERLSNVPLTSSSHGPSEGWTGSSFPILDVSSLDSGASSESMGPLVDKLVSSAFQYLESCSPEARRRELFVSRTACGAESTLRGRFQDLSFLAIGSS
jgi:hypothetical protein